MGFEASALLWWDALGSASVAQVTIGNSLPFQGQEPHEAEGGTPGAQVGAKTLGQPAFVDILCQSQAKDWARGGPLGSGPSRSGQRVWGGLRVPLEATWAEQLHGPGTTQMVSHSPHCDPGLTGTRSQGTRPGEWEQFQGILGRSPQPRNCSGMQMHHVLNGEK